MAADDDVPNLTTRILIEIRDEIRKTNDEIRKTNVEVTKTNERIDNIERQLPGLLSEMEDRLATTIETWRVSSR